MFFNKNDGMHYKDKLENYKKMIEEVENDKYSLKIKNKELKD